MRILIFFLLATCGWAANYNCTSNNSGDYDNSGIWNTCNSGIPNNSTDTFTFTVAAGHTVTLPSGVDVTVGQSLAANTAQGTLANTGKIVLAADTSGVDPTILRMKGDLAITTVTVTCTLNGATNCNGVEMNPGTVLIVDSDGSGTSYAIGQTAGGNSRWFKADCADATSMPAYNAGTTYSIGYRVSYGGVNYISVQDSNTGNTPDLFDSAYWQKGNCAILSVGATNAVFGRRGFSFGGGNVYFRHVAMKNFGTSSVDAIASMPNSTNNPVGGADITDSSFRGCGVVDLTDGDRTATSVHRFSRNIFTAGLNTTLYAVFLGTSTTAMTTGVRELVSNVIVGAMIGESGSNYCRDCTVEGNYVDHSSTNLSGLNWGGASAGSRLASLTGNFVLKNNTTQTGVNVNVPEISYNYVVNGPAINNQNTINTTTATSVGNNVTVKYNVSALLNGNTAGDSYVITQTSNAATHTYERNSIELNRDGTSTGNLITDLGASSPGGTDNHIYKNNFHIGSTYALLDMETSYHWAGSVTLQNNSVVRESGTVAKMVDVASCTLNPNDMCSAAGCNYNLGVALSYSAPGGCTNAHNFYIIDLSAGTGWGANDRDLSTKAEAMFSDLTRTFATAASDWLGETATDGAWSSSSVSYAVGDIVSDSQAGVWQGKTVLYRALAAHTSAATSRPANGATWQTACGGGPCWEYATAYFLRTKIAKGERVTDAAIGANNDYAPKAMVLWHMYGRISPRLDLACMGSDGESPWPIPYCAKGKARVAAGAF